MVHLTTVERELLEGAEGPGTAMAMRVVVATARALGAGSLVPITSAHIDGCLYHGDGGVEFAERLLGGGARVAVPTTLNVGALDLLHPGTVRSDPHETDMARRQMSAYVEMGAQPTFTCAPYQVGHEPGLGEQVAWGESNAVAFVNSVLGARTERYGDFLDACCAVTGRAPLYGLHLDRNRAAEVVVDLSCVPPELARRDVFYPVLGTWLGRAFGQSVVVMRGLDASPSRDQLKALGAAAASAGAIALFHIVGVTPEAPTLSAALGPDDRSAGPEEVAVGAADLSTALERLSTAGLVDRIDAVAIGSPHCSTAELRALAVLVQGRSVTVPFYVCTARDTWAEADEEGVAAILQGAGIEVIVDTCVVVAPILPDAGGVLMTNSGKFAHYAPANTGYAVVYGSLEDCVASAVGGGLVRDESIWTW